MGHLCIIAMLRIHWEIICFTSKINLDEHISSNQHFWSSLFITSFFKILFGLSKVFFTSLLCWSSLQASIKPCLRPLLPEQDNKSDTQRDQRDPQYVDDQGTGSQKLLCNHSRPWTSATCQNTRLQNLPPKKCG